MAAEKIKIIGQNKKAFHNFHIEKKFEAGIVLVGSEVKSLREGRLQLLDSYASFRKQELWLQKAHISEYKQGGPFFNHEPVRPRKLLLKKKEIANLEAQSLQGGYTLVPLKFYFKRGKVKVELGLGKGKHKGDKRQAIKKRDTDKHLKQAVKRNR